jgi:hypothetical protein
MLGQRKGLKNPWVREEDVFLVHPQNGLNNLIRNWCIGGCWFIPAIKKFTHPTLVKACSCFAFVLYRLWGKILLNFEHCPM